MEGNMIQAAVMGYGTIGSGVVEVLETNHESIAKRAGEGIEIKYVLDIRDFSGEPIANKVIHEYQTIVNDPDVKIVVETMGGVEPAYTFVKAMLEAGKHVTTSNKALVAEKGAELIALAKEKNVNFLFEASVGGGIPIIRPLNSCLTADEIEEITGILNGTTNYMMTKMANEGLEFDDVLKDAQEKGYAEKDPTADIEGYDACRKIAILTSLVCGQQVDFHEIHTEGITKISAVDMKYAKQMGRAIKLLASSKKTQDGYSAMVAPFLLSPEHPLYNVNDVFNAVFVHGNVLGDAMFYGSGAGKLPTASAVVADMVDIAKHLNRNIWVEWSSKELKLADFEKIENAFFVRAAADKTEIEAVFGQVEFVTLPEVSGESGFVTGVMTEAAFAEKSAELGGICSVIRVG
jgi:homoserine dehydrogenase